MSEFDSLSRVVRKTDPAGRTVVAEYDSLGRAIVAIDALGQRKEYAYDEVGNLISQKDANGNVSRYEYDSLNRQTASVLPLGQRATTTYDAVGNVSAETDFNGTTINYAYDIRDRLSAKSFPDATSVTYTYTPTGQLNTVTDLRGVTAYAYDNRERLQSRTDPDGGVARYTYDAAGNRTSLTAALGSTSQTTTFTFDRLNRVETVTDPNLGLMRYSYDSAGNLIRTELSNGVVESRSYDDLNRLLFLESRGPSGMITSFRYTIGPTGHRSAVVEQDGRRVDYSYDALNRLTRESITDSLLGDRFFVYTFDAVGNRLTRNDSAQGLTQYTYDANDRLLTDNRAGVLTQYSYDNNGNTLSHISATDQVFHTWDFENRLIATDTNGDGTIDVQNSYDDAGNRVSQAVKGQETRFLLDTAQSLSQVLVEYRPSGVILVSYVPGISQTRDGITSFYHVDGLGSMRALTNAGGNVQDRYAYDAFGVLLRQSGDTVNTNLFAGQRRDAALSLDYLRARYYDPNLGRFISPDPLRGSIAEPIYAYAMNDPVNGTDPTGLFTLKEFAVANSILGGLQGAIVGGITGGWKGAVYGGATGAVFGGAYSVGFHLLARGFGAGIYYAVSSFAVIQGATDIHTVATSESDQERFVAMTNLIFLGGGSIGTKVYYNRISGRGSYSGSGNTAQNSVGEWLADLHGARIEANGSLLNIQNGLTMSKNGTSSSLAILDGRGRSFSDNAHQIQFSAGGKKFLIVDEAQLRNNYLDFIESYGYKGPSRGAEVTVVTISGNAIIPVRTFTATQRRNMPPRTPRDNNFDPFGDTLPSPAGADTLPSRGP